MQDVTKPSPKKKRSRASGDSSAVQQSLCRSERERAVWTALHGFVAARPEQYKQEWGKRGGFAGQIRQILDTIGEG